jgi:CRISPR/Cas system-associated endoribonuclease Cas2
MAELKNDWITHGIIDFEYKKYVLLAYLKKVKEEFFAMKLYPYLADLIFHYNNIKLIQQNKSIIYNQFPKELTSADFEKLKLNYKKIIEDDEIMTEIENILEFAVPRIKDAVDQGREIYEFTEKSMEISPVGLMPIYLNEGYVMLKKDHQSEMNIYRYQITVFESSNESYKGINFDLKEKKTKSSFESFENIKISLVNQYKDLPNPATYLLECKADLPYSSTVIPVAKRMLVRYITSTQDGI